MPCENLWNILSKSLNQVTGVRPSFYCPRRVPAQRPENEKAKRGGALDRSLK